MTATIDLEPGSAEWLQLITASKVAAILGVSPWQSPRSLWHLMHGDVEPEPQNEVQARGHYLEPAILNWFFDQHPELERRSTEQRTCYNPAILWGAATPDAEAIRRDDPFTVRPVEAKSAADDSEWGTPGTDEIPVYYAAQCIWTLHITGADLIYVPVLTSRLEFREYVVEYDQALAFDIERQCLAFLHSLTEDEPPALDGHTATYESLRKVHPDIDRDARVDLDDDDAVLFIEATRAVKAAEAQYNLGRSTMADLMGTARLAYWRNRLVATRQNSSAGTPYVKPAKPLPEIPKADAS
jgi:putative phage-type endonuclease